MSPNVSERVVAITSLYENPALLPHFVAHYARLGAERIIVAVRTPQRDAVHEEALEAARGMPADVVWRASGFFADSDKADVQREILAAAGLGPNDYVLYPDADELQEYPAPLREIVREMNAHEDWALRGWVVDRIAADGTLAPIRPAPSLWEQFPVTCDFSARVLGAWTQKIVLCRFRVELAGGVYHDTVNAYYDRVPFGRSADYRVHHFKWTEGLDARIARRLHAAIGGAYRRECERFLAYYRRYGRIDLAAPELGARYEGALAYP